MKIGIASDIHLRSELPYSDLVDRTGEREDVLNAVVRAFDGCDAVVLLGDQLQSRNNSSDTLARFVKFLEQLGDRPIYILAGNHELNGDGTSALDFLLELKNKPNWHVFSGCIAYRQLDPSVKAVFLPYFHRTMLKADDVASWGRNLSSLLDEARGTVLFAHHAISGAGTAKWDTGEVAGEPLLDRAMLESKFDMIIAGHIHGAVDCGKVHVVGSVFNCEVGDRGKSVAVLDTGTMTFIRVRLPGRSIVLVENPTSFKDVEKVLEANDIDSIVKVVMDPAVGKTKIEEMRSYFSKFDGMILVEKAQGRRERANVEVGLEELSMERLLAMYSKSKDVPLESLTRAWELIRE